MRKSDPQSVEQALAELQRLIRRSPLPVQLETALTGRIPEDLRPEGKLSLLLAPLEAHALDQVRCLLPNDLRFEHLDDHVHVAMDATWRFVCRAYTQQQGDLVAAFIEEHGRTPMQRTCFFPLEWLNVATEVTLFGVRFIPAGGVNMPPYVLQPAAGPTKVSVVGVEVTGTSYKTMIGRARADAERALRLLRATLRAHHSLPDIQLRFRLRNEMWLDDNAKAWSRPPERGADLDLNDALIVLATSQPLSALPAVPTNDVEHRASWALQWFERAQLAVDPLMELLALFYGLETILGDKSEGLKAPALALRRAMLDLLTRGACHDPSDTYWLYDEVRSKAVHGEKPPEVSQRDVDALASDVRVALNQFLEFASARGLVKRKQVRDALDAHPERARIAEDLLKTDPARWRKYLQPSAPTDSDSAED